LDSQWFYCHDCQFAGDMIELAAAVWKMNPLNTLRKAQSIGIPLPRAVVMEGLVESYVEQRLNPRGRAKQFWDEARKFFMASESGSLRGLQHLLGVQEHLTPAWLEHGSIFIGAASLDTARSLFRTSHRSDLFKGKGWQDVLVIPFWDLPGRICGFLFVGRKGGVDDMIYRAAPEFVQQTRGKCGRAIEAGTTMAMAVLQQKQRHEVFGNTVFVMDDPVAALRLQIRYMRNTSIPMPLIATYDKKPYQTRCVWNWLPTDDAVFWSPKQSTETLRQAKEADAKVSLLGTKLHQDELRYRARTPESWFRQVKEKTIPWQVALQKRLDASTQSQMEELLLELDITGGELREFIAGCPPTLAKQLQDIHDGRSTVRKVPYGKRVINESSSGWAVEGGVIHPHGSREKGFVICNAILRIESILHASDGRSYYQGVVLFKNETVEFTEKVGTLDAGAWEWMKKLLVGHGFETPTALSMWTSRVMDISLRFCQPEVIWGADVVGWDTARRQFNFPKFVIQSTGDVVNDKTCLFPDPDAPGQDLVKPGPLGRQAIQALTEHNEETQIFWAMAACVANNVIAPALNFDPRGVLLDGIGAQAIGSAAAIHLGCNEFGAADGVKVQCMIDNHRSQRWPIMFHKTWPKVLGTLDATQQVIFKMPTATVNVLGIRQQWNIITCHRKLGSMRLVKDAAPRVLAAYIRDLCERRLWLKKKHPSETDNILDDMSGWFHRQGGDPVAVLRARNILRVPGRPTGEIHFMELLRYLRREGAITQIRDGYDDVGDRMPTLADSDERKEIWIPQRSIIDLVEASASIPLDLLPVTRTLQQCGCLRGEIERDGKMGWAVDAVWFYEHWDALEAKHLE
jgi:hypothetical protein